MKTLQQFIEDNREDILFEMSDQLNGCSIYKHRADDVSAFALTVGEQTESFYAKATRIMASGERTLSQVIMNYMEQCVAACEREFDKTDDNTVIAGRIARQDFQMQMNRRQMNLIR
jgi:hypothetical protein